MSRIDETRRRERRRFLRAFGVCTVAAAGATVALPRLFATGIGSSADLPSLIHTTRGDVLLEIYAADGRDLGPRRVPKLVLTDEQWHQRMSSAAFDVMRRNGTELAFSGPHERPAQPGIFRCAGCDTALYDAATEFDSGTGWPSFWQPINQRNVVRSSDDQFGMWRIAISCGGCDSHLGHVFSDGPQPTGLRYCMNSVALRFVAHATG
ncbi:MAG: peptide-methionine (R)-S-oxide reductase MsrB [Rhodanobacteraceae bacterium]